MSVECGGDKRNQCQSAGVSKVKVTLPDSDIRQIKGNFN
jgi:hypothetical protein